MTIGMYIAISSILIGFLLFGASFYSYMHRKPRKIWLGLIIISLLFLTLIPVTMALFWAA